MSSGISKRRRYSRARSYKRSWGRRIPTASKRKLRAVANLRTGGQFGIERKFHDVYIATSVGPLTAVTLPNSIASAPMPAKNYTGTPGSPASLYYLNLMTVGSAAYQRDGRVIKNHSLEIQGHVHWNHTGAAAAFATLPIVCVALVLDTQANGGSPAVTGANIYEDVGGGITLPLRKMDNTTRYRVLAFKRIVKRPDVGYDGVTSYGTQETVFRMYRKLGFKTNFIANAAATPAISDLIDNGLFVMAWYAGGGVAPTLSASCRLRFTG